MAARHFAMQLPLSLLLIVAGCGGQAQGQLPANAIPVTTQRGPTIFPASETGRVFVVDLDADRLLAAGAIRSGQRLVIDPDRNQVLLNGADIKQTDLDPGNQFRVYFAKE